MPADAPAGPADGLAAMPQITARLASERRSSWAIIAAVLIVAAAVVPMILSVTPVEENRRWFLALGGLVVVGVLAGEIVNRRYGARVAREVMPLLAQAVGLKHDWVVPELGHWQGKGLLPKHTKQPPANDQISGTLGNLRFSSWDMKLVSGGKNSTTVFEGLVVTLEPVGHAALFVKKDHKGAAGWMQDRFGKAPAGLSNHGVVSLRGHDWELWLAPGAQPGFDVKAGLEALCRVLPAGASLRALMQERGRAHVAINLKGGLVDLGGLFVGKEALRGRIDAALGALAVPAKIAAAWSDAQRQG